MPSDSTPPVIDRNVLQALIFDAFTSKLTWLEASRRYPVETYITAFRNTRMAFHRLLADMTDAQVSYISPEHSLWSVSETITHLIYSQNSYYNFLLEITDSILPHIMEAARGFGEGAQRDIPAQTLRQALDAATLSINQGIDATLPNVDPAKTRRNVLFGEVSYATWVFLLMAHEFDHYRQAHVMKRLARAAFPDRGGNTT
ncbi:MAG: hypothetical protein OHK0023_25500 [Anaerolineae bacterium]